MNYMLYYFLPPHFNLRQPPWKMWHCSDVKQSTNLKSPFRGDLEGSKRKKKYIMAHYFFLINYSFEALPKEARIPPST